MEILLMTMSNILRYETPGEHLPLKYFWTLWTLSNVYVNVSRLLSTRSKGWAWLFSSDDLFLPFIFIQKLVKTTNFCRWFLQWIISGMMVVIFTLIFLGVNITDFLSCYSMIILSTYLLIFHQLVMFLCASEIWLNNKYQLTGLNLVIFCLNCCIKNKKMCLLYKQTVEIERVITFSFEVMRQLPSF